MCGIAGFLLSSPDNSPGDPAEIAWRMGAAIRHRGPDAGDIWLDKDAGIAFSHRRLSIIDISEAGAQPMTSSCGRYVICYNGEIYNAGELRKELLEKGRSFRGRSDTEVILEGCAAWGVKATAKRLIGMFAFALWDTHDHILALVRDRVGIKPLYVGEFSGSYVFASELRAMHVFTKGPPTIDRQGVASYLYFGYVPTPKSIFKGIRKLSPGRVLFLKRGSAPREETFWSLASVVETARNVPLDLPADVWRQKVEDLLRDSIERRMESDVPLGAFLSGGIDSSLVVAMMQEVSDRPIKSFSIGFADASYNEAQYAKKVAKHLKTDHTELYISEKDLLDTVPGIAGLYDEPFADSSSIPTFALSKLTRDNVTVALSGDGGDELFAGYNRYRWAAKIDALRTRTPRPIRNLLANAMSGVPALAYDWLASPVRNAYGLQAVGYRVHKLADTIRAESAEDVYHALISFWRNLLPEGETLNIPDGFYAAPECIVATEEKMQFVDTLTYLPDDILTKVDRASMAASLEVRVPLLDHRIVELSWQIPFQAKLKGDVGKVILREILSKYVPRELFERPKMGFGVPLEAWLRGPLKSWCHGLLKETDWGVFGLEEQRIMFLWKRFLRYGNPDAYRIWVLVVLASWRHSLISESAGFGEDGP